MKFNTAYNSFLEAVLKRECAWCGKDMGEKTVKDKKTPDKFDGEKTHGICKKCMKQVLDGWKKDKEKEEKG